MRSGLAASREAFKTRTVDQEYVEPTVVVVIVKRDSTAGSLEQVLIFMLAAEDCFDVQARFFGDIDEADSNVGAWYRLAFRRRRLLKIRKGVRSFRPGQSKNIFQRQYQRGTAE